ncbi:unnamed protein product [Musa acuminata var. zebrina]
MAVDHSSIPRDLRPSAAPGRAQPPPPWVLPGGPLFSPAAAVAGGNLSPRKVKLLCSFGGRILPRPSDGALRYAGGHTRIISLRKDVSFPEFVGKMAEAVGASAVAVKYQLPGEDLDALISISCPEDLVNMMEEYDKLATASPDGSAKLRAFLFSPSDLASADPSLHLGAVVDVGQRYFEAVNGFAVSDGGGGPLRKRDSGASAASSTQNSDSTTIGDAAEDGASEGMSPSLPSPVVDWPHDAPRSVYPGVNNPIVSPDSPVGIPSGSVLAPGMGVPAQNAPFSRLEKLPMVVPYTPPAYVEPHQLQYITPQHLGLMAGLQPINVAPVTMASYVPGGVSSSMLSVTSQVDNLQAIQPRLVPGLENPYGGRISPIAADQNLKAFQPLSQLPPLPPTYLPPPLPPPLPPSILEDCLMCQKALPHAHSDTLVLEHGIETLDNFHEVGKMFYSQRSEDLAKHRVATVVTGAPASNMMEPSVESMNTLNQSAGSPLPHITELRHANKRPNAKKADDCPGVVELPAEANTIIYAENPSTQDHAHQFTDHNVEPVKGKMVTLSSSPFGPSKTICQGRPAVALSDDPSDVKLDVPYLVVQNGHKVIPQSGDNALLIGNSTVNDRFIPEGNYAKPIEQPPSATSEFTQLESLLKDYELNQGMKTIENYGPFPYSQGIGIEHSAPYENFHTNVSNTNPFTAFEIYSSQLPSRKKPNNLAVYPGGSIPFPLSSMSNPSENTESFSEIMASDRDFYDQDPFKVLGHANVPQPRPNRIVSKESVVLNDPCIAHHRTNKSDIIAMLEEGNFHHPADSMIKDLYLEPDRLTKASEEERIKQQLQAVAEDVAALALQPSVPTASVALGTQNLGSIEGSKELEKAILDEEIEESISTQLDEENSRVQLSEDIGHLQIINNSDLEELQELGSGTFGTVYHGKWRGTDVAIKRINDRCFAGKKSEAERMRADFWNEACKLADLHHPNVVAFYGVVLDVPGGNIATVTEYMVNGSLRRALHKNDKAFDRRKRLLIAMDVAFGMEYLHAKNIVHFDLKSDNLLVNLRDPQRPICKVGDLGLSKVKCKTLISGGMRGTLPWMAPELLYGNDSLVSEKVDVFSFGVMMWEILTGEEPYADLHYGAIIGGILSNTLRPPVPEFCGSEWRLLMEQCWSAEPQERPSFTEITNRLRSMAASIVHKGQPQARK